MRVPRRTIAFAGWDKLTPAEQKMEAVPAEQARSAAIVEPVTDKLAGSYDPALLKPYNDELA